MSKLPLTLNADTFNAFKQDFDRMLRALLARMEEWDSDEATISAKMKITMDTAWEPDWASKDPDATVPVKKPIFEHDISTTLQVKSKQHGSLVVDKKLVWDKALQEYTLEDIYDGQLRIVEGGAGRV